MPKPKPLTKLDCDHAKPRSKPYKLSAGYGLYLEVMPTGSKLWRYKYNWHGKEKRLALGPYPTVSLREARDKLETAKNERRNGIDPSGARQERKRLAKINAQNTFKAIATAWHTYHHNTWDILDCAQHEKLEPGIYDIHISVPPLEVGNLPPEILASNSSFIDRSLGFPFLYYTKKTKLGSNRQN